MADKVEFIAQRCSDWACAVAWLDHWQTLVGAAIAIPFAALAILFPVLQEANRRRRHFAAMRASMPLRLSLVCDYATDMMHALGGILRGPHDDGSVAEPEIPPGLVDGLETTIESLQNQRAISRLSDIIVEMQMLNSRLKAPTRLHRDALLLQAAIIWAQAASLFEFARRQTDWVSREVKWEDVKLALTIAQIYEGSHQSTHDYVTSLSTRKKVSDPWDSGPRFRARSWFSIWQERVLEWMRKMTSTD
jgi:hypothetical protein